MVGADRPHPPEEDAHHSNKTSSTKVIDDENKYRLTGMEVPLDGLGVHIILVWQRNE